MRIRTEKTFDAAHRLPRHEGKCSRLHGHTWRVEVEVWGEIKSANMVIDFGKLKEAIEQYDHKTLLSRNDSLYPILKEARPEDVVEFTEQPTSEWLSQRIAEDIVSNLDEEKIEKIRIKVWESPKSYAEEVIHC